MMNHEETKELEYDHIVDGLYVGTNSCCEMHFNEILAKKEGITADVSLEEDKIDAPFGVDFYLWLPVKDHAAPKMDQLQLGVHVLNDLISFGRKVYIHCKNGHGRAPTLVAAYLINKGKTAEEAERIIKEKRPETHLEDAQRKILKEFASQR